MSLHLKRIEAYRLSLLKEEVLEEEEKNIVQEVISESDETASTIKYKYESNADTNAYTDAEKTKVANAGIGDVVGPASATNENVAVFDGITGKLIKDGGATVSDLTNNISDANATALTDGGETALHSHAAVASFPPLIYLKGANAPPIASSNTTGTIILWAWVITVEKDSEFTHSSVTNNSRIQVNQDGVYAIDFSAYWTGAYAHERLTQVKINGTAMSQWNDVAIKVSGSTPAIPQMHSVFDLSNGDYIEIQTVVLNPGAASVSTVVTSYAEITVTQKK